MDCLAKEGRLVFGSLQFFIVQEHTTTCSSLRFLGFWPINTKSITSHCANKKCFLTKETRLPYRGNNSWRYSSSRKWTSPLLHWSWTRFMIGFQWLEQGKEKKKIETSWYKNLAQTTLTTWWSLSFPGMSHGDHTPLIWYGEKGTWFLWYFFKTGITLI